MNTNAAVAAWSCIIISSIYNTSTTPNSDIYVIVWLLFSFIHCYNSGEAVMSYLKVFYYILLSWCHYCIGHVASVVTDVTDRFGYHEACCVWYRIYSTNMNKSLDIQDTYNTPDTVRYFPWSPASIK